MGSRLPLSTVLRGLLNGLSEKELAQKLHVSYGGVRNLLLEARKVYSATNNQLIAGAVLYEIGVWHDQTDAIECTTDMRRVADAHLGPALVLSPLPDLRILYANRVFQLTFQDILPSNLPNMLTYWEFMTKTVTYSRFRDDNRTIHGILLCKSALNIGGWCGKTELERAQTSTEPWVSECKRRYSSAWFDIERNISDVLHIASSYNESIGPLKIPPIINEDKKLDFVVRWNWDGDSSAFIITYQPVGEARDVIEGAALRYLTSAKIAGVLERVK